MSTREGLITVAAVLVLVASMGTVWGIGQYKDTQALEAQKDALVQNSYETPVVPQQYRIVIVEAPEREPAATGIPVASNRTALPSPSTATVGSDRRPTGTVSPSGGGGTTPVAARTPDRVPTQTPDYDGDGIPDTSDRCPTRPETVNGFQDGDGCPDIAATTGAS